MINFFQKSVIIVAGGTGSRMNAGMPKQFLLLAGKPMLMRSIGAFSLAYPDISLVLALPASQFSAWKQLCNHHAFKIPHQLVAGGETRFHSVQNALSMINGDGLVAIHDGARPLVSESLIREVFLTASHLGNCIPVVPIRESVRIIAGDTNRAANRNDYRVVQTPQVFHATVLRKAYDQEFRESFTDDATVVESIGEVLHLVDGDPVNMKITYPYDLVAAEAMLGKI